MHCAFLAPTAAAQNTITLHAAARVDEGRPITVQDIADIAGPDAAAIGSVVVQLQAAGEVEQREPGEPGEPSSPARSWSELDLAAVRSALAAADFPEGRIALNGSSCAVRFVRPITDLPGPPASAAPARPSAPTIRDAIVAQLVRFYNVPASDLRLTFRARAESSDLLDRPLQGEAGRIDIQPGAADSSARVPVHVFVFEGDRLTVNETVLVDALVRRPVLIARRTIERRETINADDFLLAEQWVPAGDTAPARPDAAAGAQASSRIQAGEVITAAHVEPPIVADRGDIVTVYCLAGAFSIQLRARAMEKGRDGQVIPFRAEGAGRDAQTFLARLSGPGKAVMIADLAGGDADALAASIQE